MNELTIISRETNLVSFPTQGSYEIAVTTMEKYLTSEQTKACVENLQMIDRIETSLTIENLMVNGNFSEEDTKMYMNLRRFEINPDRMTIEEARLINDFATDATEEIIDKKVEKIRDILTNVINGVHHHRDYSFDEDRSMLLRQLVDKGIQYDLGKYDMSRGFDVSIYPKNPYQSNEFIGLGVTLDDISKEEFLGLVDTMSDEELLDGDYIDEEDFFKYGPYTIRDIKLIATFTDDTWSRATDQRNYSRLESLLNNFINPCNNDIEYDINRSYIEGLVLPTRRPNGKNIIALLSSFGQQCNDVIFIGANKINEDLKDELNSLKKSLGWCSYYAYHICGLRSTEVKEKYKLARPISSDFYLDILSRSEKWNDKQVNDKERYFHSYFNKIDTWLFEAQASYVNLISGMKKSSSSEMFIKGLLQSKNNI